MSVFSCASAINFETVQGREKLAKALAQSQTLAEELESQQEELRTTNEELEEQTQSLEESEQKLKAQQEELEVANEELMEKTGLLPGEKVLVADITNAARVETYVILEQRGSGIIRMNGAAARVVKTGDQVIIMGFELAEEPIEAKNVLVDERNRFVRYL